MGDARYSSPVDEVRDRIRVIRDDRRAHEHILEDAMLLEIRADAAAEAARAEQQRARRRINEDGAEIAALEVDLQALIPRQRPPT